VALKRFVDDFSVLAVEACLIAKLHTVFGPVDILEMDDAMVLALASESEDAMAQRSRSEEKLHVLENGLKALRDMQGYESGSADVYEGILHVLCSKRCTNHADRVIKQHRLGIRCR